MNAVKQAPWPRLTNLALGAWLFLSAFLWLHSDSSQLNTWLTGLAVMVVSIVGIVVPRVRMINAVAAGWLLLSALILPHASQITVWNNLIIALVVFAIALTPNRGMGRRVAL